MINSFGEMAGNVTSPLHHAGEVMPEYTSSQYLRERKTEQIATENSAVNLNLMEAKFHM